MSDGEQIERKNWGSVYGLTRLNGTIVDGPCVVMWVRETNLLRRKNGRWLVVHDHVSVPFDFATGKALTDLKPLPN